MVQQHQPPLNEIGQAVHPFLANCKTGDRHRQIGPDNAGSIVTGCLQNLFAARAVQFPGLGDLLSDCKPVRAADLPLHDYLLVAGGRKAGGAGQRRFLTGRSHLTAQSLEQEGRASLRPATGKSSACRR